MPRPGADKATLLHTFAANKVADGELPPIVVGYLEARNAATPDDSARLVLEYGLPHKCVCRTERLGKPVVLEALLVSMPFTALIRNLGSATRAGVVARSLRAPRPFLVTCGPFAPPSLARAPNGHLIALSAYLAGHGVRGAGSWTPVQEQVVDALDAAFYDVLSYVTPTNRRLLERSTFPAR